MLPECPLSALHDHSAVLTGRGGHLANPVGGALSHQFPQRGFDAPALLVVVQGRSSGDKPRLQAAKQQ